MFEIIGFVENLIVIKNNLKDINLNCYRMSSLMDFMQMKNAYQLCAMKEEWKLLQ